MIYIDFLDQHYDDVDSLIDWFIQGLVDIEDSRYISSELAAFLKECFPDINANNLHVHLVITPAFDAGFQYNEINLEYNEDELKQHYPEYFL